MVTSAGFNALLKLVEEPPEHVKFVFATTEPDKVIGTIRSRTHHYPFRLIPPQVLGPYLREVCDAENVAVGDGVLPLVVRAGGGSARDSMSVLDQLMAGAGDDGLDFPTAIALLGFTDTALLDRAVEAISQRDAGTLYGVVEEVISTGHEPRRFVEDLLERIRDLIVLAAVPDRGGDLLPHIPADDLERMHAQASTFQPVDLSTAGELVHETLSTMSGATSPRVHLELLAARLVLRDQTGAGAVAGQAGVQPEPQAGSAGGTGRDEARRIAQERADAARQARGVRAPAQSPAQPAQSPAQQSQPPAQQSQPPAQQSEPPVQRTEGPVRQEPAASPPSQPAPQESRPEESAPAPEPAAPTQQQPPAQSAGGSAGGGLDPDEVRGHWSAIMDELAQIRRPSWALLSQNSHVHGAEGSTLILGFRTEGLLSAFRRGTAAQNLAEAVQRIMRVQVTVDAVVGEDPGPGPGPGGGGSGGPGGTGGSGGGPDGRPDGPAAPRGGGADRGSQQTRPQRGGAPSDQTPGNDEPVPGSARDRAAQSWGDVAVATPGGTGGTSAQGERPAPDERPAPPAAAPRDAAPQRDARPEQAPRHEPRGVRTPPPSEDFPPEPDDPYPPDPDDSSWGAAAPQPDPASAPSSAPAAASAAPPAPEDPAASSTDDEIPVVEDEGRDSLPEGEPRTYGQAALRRAIAEGRVVHSRPAAGTGAPTGADRPADAAGGNPSDSASDQAGAPAAGSAGSFAAGSAPTAPPASAPALTQQQADTPQHRERAPQHGEPAQRPRSGADLAREAALASRNAGRKFGVVRNGPGPGADAGTDPAEDDPTGGATRDDEDAEYTRRTGREVIESVLGGKVLEVIEERPEY